MPVPRLLTDPERASQLARPLLAYDGECAFCKRSVSRWKSATGDRVEYLPYQQVAVQFPEIPLSDFEDRIHLIEPDGRVSTGAHAILRALAIGGSRRGLLWAYEHVPGVAGAIDVLYGLVSRHRGGAARMDRYFRGNLTEQPTWFISRWLFLHLLGLTYLLAFLSLWPQIDGLIGDNGILPIGTFLTSAQEADGRDAYFNAPTLSWLDPSGRFLHILCAAGVVLSCVLMAGLAQGPALVLLWILYLSFVNAGQDFLRFQWDALLLETGFLSLFYAPWTLRPRLRERTSPATIPRLLLWWLLFRLVFSSGIVKLISGDPTWPAGTALTFHYQTQPLPPWTAWYMHHLPASFQKLSCFGVWFFEILIPILYFAPRRFWHMACWATMFFQLLITATGNFGFFNLLTIALAVTLLDDQRFRIGLRERMVPNVEERRACPWRGWVLAPVGAMVLILSITQFVNTFNRTITWPAPLADAQEFLFPFHIANRYGLFARMTTTRDEIIIEGSDDGGRTWKPYELRFKPGDVHRRPAWLGPHMPRLDWQMWFAALGTWRDHVWFQKFVYRLLLGSADVQEQLAFTPFADRPPKHIRAVLYRYEFTPPAERRETGAWWKRERLGLYLRAVSLDDFNPPRTEDR